MNHRLARPRRRRNPQAAIASRKASRTSGGAQPSETKRRRGQLQALRAGCRLRAKTRGLLSTVPTAPGLAFSGGTLQTVPGQAAECQSSRNSLTALPSVLHIRPPISTPHHRIIRVDREGCTVSGPGPRLGRLPATWPDLDLTPNPAGPGPRRARAHPPILPSSDLPSQGPGRRKQARLSWGMKAHP